MRRFLGKDQNGKSVREGDYVLYVGPKYCFEGIATYWADGLLIVDDICGGFLYGAGTGVKWSDCQVGTDKNKWSWIKAQKETLKTTGGSWAKLFDSDIIGNRPTVVSEYVYKLYSYCLNGVVVYMIAARNKAEAVRDILKLHVNVSIKNVKEVDLKLNVPYSVYARDVNGHVIY